MQFWIKFWGLVALRVLLAPLFFLIEAICLLTWSPRFLCPTTIRLESMLHSPDDVYTKSSMWLAPEAYGLCGDGPKFIGMAVASLPASSQRDAADKFYLSYFDYPNKTLLRYPVSNYESNDLAPTFSGDMLSGFLLGFSERYAKTKSLRHSTNGALGNAEDRAFLPKAADGLLHTADSIIFSGMPFKISHPSRRDNSRGFIWCPWEPGCATFQATIAYLKTLRIAAIYRLYHPESDVVRTFTKLIKVFECMNKYLTLGHEDLALFCGKVYYKAWYSEHTQALNAYVDVLTTSITSPEDVHSDMPSLKTLSALSDKYPHNADIVSMYSAAYAIVKSAMGMSADLFTMHTMTENALFAISNYPLGARADGVFTPTEENDRVRSYAHLNIAGTSKYFSLKSFVFKEMYNEVAPPIMFADSAFYIWETNRITPQVVPALDSTLNQGHTLDGVFPTYFYNKAIALSA